MVVEAVEIKPDDYPIEIHAVDTTPFSSMYTQKGTYSQDMPPNRSSNSPSWDGTTFSAGNS